MFQSSPSPIIPFFFLLQWPHPYNWWSNTYFPFTSFILSQNNNANPRLDNNLQNNNTTADQWQHDEEEEQSDKQQHALEEEQPNEEQHHPLQSLIPHLTIRIPPQHQAAHLRTWANFADHTTAFISEYIPVCNTHELLPANLSLDGFPTVEEVLSILVDGFLKPTIDADDEPLWAQAIASDEQEYWIAGSRDELRSLEDLKVFVLVPQSELPHGHHPLKGKLVCKRKHDSTGKIVHYKVHYVAKGFAECYSIDYNKTTALTVRLESFHSILHLAVSHNWELWQFNIKMAFLHSVLPKTKTMFMEQPPGFEVPGKEEWVMELMKSIYGMKQVSCIWNQTFHKAVLQRGFKHLSCEAL